MFGDFYQTAQHEGKEKHVPVIHAPETVKAGEFFPITIAIGEEVPHPNLAEHHIKWMQVFAHYEGSKNPVHIATFDWAPIFVDPKITFNMRLDKPATIYALSYCNIHGVWESSVKINV